MIDGQPKVVRTGRGRAYDHVATTIRRRRTSLLLDPDRPIGRDLVVELLELATWAPNHHRTWPWRFAVVTGEGRRRLGELVAAYEADQGAAPERRDKVRGKYLRAPVVVLVGMAADPDPVRRQEDRDAVAAAVQNLLLAATAAGLASHWATGAWMDDAAVKALAGLGPDDDLVALVYLGWPTGDPLPVDRPPVEVTWVER
jgi:nitroreductase